jgi:hypothetical protein
MSVFDIKVQVVDDPIRSSRIDNAGRSDACGGL